MTTRLISTATEPVSVAEAKLRLRIDGTDDDADLGMMISAARSMCEQQTGRAIALSTYELRIDAFPAGEIRLMWPPVASVESITYLDADGAEQTLPQAAYALDAHSEPGWILPAHGTDWPATIDAANAVTVTYTAGEGADCPAALKQWILLHVGHWYRNREAATDRQLMATPFSDGLLDRYRVW